MQVVILGLSITSSWGNGHAVTWRSLAKGLSERGHDVLFLERDMPWYADHRDMPEPPFCRSALYGSLTELKDRWRSSISNADLVIVGSYVPQGVSVGEWVTATANGVTAFYDIDTPVTLSKLDRGDSEYLTRALVMRYDIYLSFTGGPTLSRLEKRYCARAARALYCSVDPDLYYPDPQSIEWDLGYLGTWSDDRQPALERLLLKPALQRPQAVFCVAGSLYPESLTWPDNVQRIAHLPPAAHREFYNAQRFALNVTRADMIRAGFSPSVRLFEAAACGTPVISDLWEGLDDIFKLGSEILVARSTAEMSAFLQEIGEKERVAIGQRARARVLSGHTGVRRAEQLEAYAGELAGSAVCNSRAAV